MMQIEKGEHSLTGDKLSCISEGVLSRGDKQGIVGMEISVWHQFNHESELQVDVYDETLEAKGDFVPLYFSKEETKELIDYLTYCYERM